MDLEIADIRDIFWDWEANLSLEQKKYRHFYSFRNFIFHYAILPDCSKQDVLELLRNYIVEVKSPKFIFDKEESYNLARKYLDKIAKYYKVIGFKLNLRFGFIIFWGLITDFLLYLINFLPKINHTPIPLLTCIMLVYYFYIALLKKPKRLVYGLFY